MVLGREEELLLVRVNRELRSYIALLEKVQHPFNPIETSLEWTALNPFNLVDWSPLRSIPETVKRIQL